MMKDLAFQIDISEFFRLIYYLIHYQKLGQQLKLDGQGK